MGDGEQCKECTAHSGICVGQKDMKGDLKIVRGDIQSLGKEKCSMKLFYVLILVLLAVFGSTFALQLGTKSTVSAIQKNVAVVQQSVQHIQDYMPKP